MAVLPSELKALPSLGSCPQTSDLETLRNGSGDKVKLKPSGLGNYTEMMSVSFAEQRICNINCVQRCGELAANQQALGE